MNTIFYGWKLGFLCCFGNLLLQGGAIYLMNALIEPLSSAYGWSRGDLGVAMGIGSFCGVLSMSFLSSLAMRVPLRALMTAGALVGGAGMIVIGQTSHLMLFTIAFAAIWIAGQACGGVIANALMSHWFIKNRGRAFGLANVGTSFSGAVIPLLALVMLDFFSISVTMWIIGGFILVVLVPLSWTMVRDHPEDIGLHPDGAPTAAPLPSAAATQNLTWAALAHSPKAYKLGIAFGIGLMIAAGAVGQLKPRFVDLGFSSYMAMALMCMTAFFGALSKYFWGWVADKLNPLRTAKILYIATIASLTMVFLPQNLFTALLYVVFVGSCMGGFWTVLPAMVAHFYGRAQFMAAYRFIALFIMIKSFGYMVMGWSHQWTGSYNAGYGFFIVLLVVGFGALVSLTKEPTVEA